MFLSHIWTPRIERHFDRLVRECGSEVEWRPVGDRADVSSPDPSHTSETVLSWRFEQMRRNGGVQGGFMDTVIWPRLLDIDADFTWVMEYDVDFAGDWAQFFQQFRTSSADLLTTTITPRPQFENWFWWKSAAAPPHVPRECMVRAFLPLMRVSRQFAQEYATAVQDPRWGGHYEFTIPTVAMAAGLVVEDIGGDGPFCPKARRNCNYRNSSRDERTAPGTFVWRPSRKYYFFEEPESFPEPDLLYHPVKAGVPDWSQQFDLDTNAITIVPPTKFAALKPVRRGLPTTVSVMLTTYNGERYLQEQLESLASQALPPNELIVCDDGSTDSTVEIAREFASNASFSVEVVRNQKNIGYSRNAMSAVRRCRGELIFFCDQDDIWSPRKISTIAEMAVASPEEVISHDISVFSDDPGKPSFPSYFAYLNRLELPAAACIKGCAMAVKAQFLRRWGWPRGDVDVAYDFWIALLATAFGHRRYVAEPLISHRLHDKNTSGWIASEKHHARHRGRRSDSDLLVKLYIQRWNLAWTDELARVLRERCSDRADVDATSLLRSLDENRAHYSWLMRRLRRFSLAYTNLR